MQLRSIKYLRISFHEIIFAKVLRFLTFFVPKMRSSKSHVSYFSKDFFLIFAFTLAPCTPTHSSYANTDLWGSSSNRVYPVCFCITYCDTWKMTLSTLQWSGVERKFLSLHLDYVSVIIGLFWMKIVSLTSLDVLIWMSLAIHWKCFSETTHHWIVKLIKK